MVILTCEVFAGTCRVLPGVRQKCGKFKGNLPRIGKKRGKSPASLLFEQVQKDSGWWIVGLCMGG